MFGTCDRPECEEQVSHLLGFMRRVGTTTWDDRQAALVRVYCSQECSAADAATAI